MTNVAVGILTNNDWLNRQGGELASPRKVLLCQRKRSSRYGLKWEFPGGKVEANEEVRESLRRELLEELGIVAHIGRLYHRQMLEYEDGGTFDVSFFLVENYDGVLVNHVFESYTWVDVTRLHEYDILLGNKKIVQKLIDGHG